ncbi:hypothetical protein EJ05DRAFT_304524 [Pseudovirgaria hyperparasitica]|uniref:Uncharacterized protein n=1 Tax=Pseudovirgaria hyperparasitica TaxID=470096 RepID=A0A6A6WDJ4_9PEZI|nr:uncharacterized protein EJ05DRAFT_304524 [Pseudovirgaria hyperparasitica]KAF2759627.1 hypothetical protein EJ05DRAFT_304524 [Pseudovirgaria hyperparasitica]
MLQSMHSFVHPSIHQSIHPLLIAAQLSPAQPKPIEHAPSRNDDNDNNNSTQENSLSIKHPTTMPKSTHARTHARTHQSPFLSIPHPTRRSPFCFCVKKERDRGFCSVSPTCAGGGVLSPRAGKSKHREKDKKDERRKKGRTPLCLWAGT